jgi:hypothetical protein
MEQALDRYEAEQSILRKRKYIIFPPNLIVPIFPTLYLITLFRRYFENILRNIRDTTIAI